MIFLASSLLAFVITLGSMFLLKEVAPRVRIIDIPNDRKVHTRPIPRIGGISMALGIFVSIVCFAALTKLVMALLLGGLIILVFGVADDIYELAPLTKLLGQIIAAMILIFHGGVLIKDLGDLVPGDWLLPGWLAVPFTLVAVVGGINAINLSDGLDGLAGGISMLGFLFIAFLSYQASQKVLALIAISIAGAILGFLHYNTYPATIFMGDSGSQLLGFMGIGLAIAVTQSHMAFNRVLPLLLLGVPIFDTVTVMMERKARGRPLFVADKNHFHHKLIRFGLFHTEAVATIYLLQFVLIMNAYMFRFSSEWFLLILYTLFCTIISLSFRQAEQ